MGKTMNTNTERHAAYKDSGVAWLGAVPAHWAVRRHKDAFQLVSLRCLNSSLLKVALENIEGKTGCFIPTESEFDGDGIQFKKNDILFGKLRPYLAKVYLAEFSGNAIGDIFVYRCKSKNSPLFFAYLMRSDLYIDVINGSTAGAKMPRASSGFIADLPVALPPLPEQIAIAAYLDTQTAQIDRKIELLNQKAKAYAQLKQSLINETVTRGLDTSVPMKDSGVAWLGAVPAHWAVQRIGTAFEERSEKVNDTDYPPLSVSMAGIVPQMESVAKTDNNENRKRVAIGDYVINSRSDRRGASGISIYDGSVSVISIVLSPKRAFFGKYLHHLFRSYRFIEEFYRVGRGIVEDLWTTRYSVMKGIEFSYPPYEEQAAIAAYLDTQTAQIDRIAANLNQQIEQLQTLRKALINEVVTGQIKIPHERLAA
jgi:type I restriction enzyme S subunit